MKKNYTQTSLVDEYLKSVSGMQPADTDPFFYTRLKARMEKKWVAKRAQTNLKWGFVVGTLAIFLAVNCWMLSHPQKLQSQEPDSNMQRRFAETYSIGNSPAY